MPLHRKKIFRIPAPAPTTIYVRPGYNRVLAEQFEALKRKRVELVKDKVEAHSQGDLRENFGFKAAKDAIRAVDRKMTALDRFVARNTFIEVDPALWLTKPTDTAATRARGHDREAGRGDESKARVHVSHHDAWRDRQRSGVGDRMPAAQFPAGRRGAGPVAERAHARSRSPRVKPS